MDRDSKLFNLRSEGPKLGPALEAERVEGDLSHARTERAREDALGREDDWQHTVLFSGEPIESWLFNIAVFGLRLVTGIGISILDGWTKIPPTTDFVASLSDKGMPLAYLVGLFIGAVEVVAGVLLAFGLMTRLASLCLSCVFTVALFVWYADQPLWTHATVVAYFGPCAFFLLMGGGMFSVDAFMRGALKREDASERPLP